MYVYIKPKSKLPHTNIHRFLFYWTVNLTNLITAYVVDMLHKPANDIISTDQISLTSFPKCLQTTVILIYTNDSFKEYLLHQGRYKNKLYTSSIQYKNSNNICYTNLSNIQWTLKFFDSMKKYDAYILKFLTFFNFINCVNFQKKN